MSDLKHVILDLVQKHLPDAEHFIVEVKIDRVADKTKIQILVDADQGMTIAACASLSRALSGELETNEELVLLSFEVGFVKDLQRPFGNFQLILVIVLDKLVPTCSFCLVTVESTQIGVEIVRTRTARACA